jgi:hypothetical protein
VADIDGQILDVPAVLREPCREHISLGLAFGIAEVTRHEDVAVHDPGVRREHEVGDVRLRLDEFDLCAGSAEIRDELVPLLLAAIPVDGHLAMHPRIDLVEHTEVVGRAHQVAPSPSQLAQAVRTSAS